MKLLLIEDHPFITESLQTLLGDEIDISIATSCHQAIEFINEEDEFSLVLLDIGLPDHDGCSVLKFFQSHVYFPPVLVITGNDNQSEVVSNVMKMGAKGFFHKTQSPRILLEGMEVLLSGNEFWPADFLPMDQKDTDAVNALASHLGITPRQLSVLRLLEDGLQNKQIADAMGISEETVKSHIRALYDSLAAHTRGSCVKTARQLGLLK